jgi:hypothetical protein
VDLLCVARIYGGRGSGFPIHKRYGPNLMGR